MARRPRLLASGVLYHVIVRRESQTEDVFERERLPSLFRKVRPVSETIGRDGLCLLSDAQPCSSASGDRIAAVIPIYARAATILHTVF